MVLNKKGVIGDAFDFLTVVVASFFLWLVVSIVLVGPIEENKKITLENIDEVNSNLVLLNYLRTTTLNGQQVSDLIIAAEIDPKAQKNLESLTNKLILDSNNYLFKRIMIKFLLMLIYRIVLVLYILKPGLGKLGKLVLVIGIPMAT